MIRIDLERDMTTEYRCKRCSFKDEDREIMENHILFEHRKRCSGYCCDSECDNLIWNAIQNKVFCCNGHIGHSRPWLFCGKCKERWLEHWKDNHTTQQNRDTWFRSVMGREDFVLLCNFLRDNDIQFELRSRNE